MPYALLDDQFHNNPKIAAVGLDGAGLYARALSYCGDYTTDGFVPHWWAKAIVGRRRTLLERLETAGLWTPTGPGDVLEMVDRKGNNVHVHVHENGYFIADFVQLNVSSVEAANRRAEKSKAGKKGAIKRWADSKPHGTSHTDSNGNSHSTSHTVSHGKTDGKRIARAPGARGSPTPTTPPAEAGLTPTTHQHPAPANEHHPNNTDPIAKLTHHLRDADHATEHVLRTNYGHLPEAAFAYTLEEIHRCAPTTTSDAALATTILQRITDTGHIGNEAKAALSLNGSDSEKTGPVDLEAAARELFGRTGDREQVADWLAGIRSLNGVERAALESVACDSADEEPELGG